MTLKHFNVKFFFSRLIELITSKIFLILTFIGNSLALCFATLFYLVEHGENPHMKHYIDAVWWSFSTVTTVGYGDITPVTILGKLIGIFLMLGGITIFVTYTALFANFFINPQLFEVDKEVKNIKKEMVQVESELNQDEKNLAEILTQLKKISKEIEYLKSIKHSNQNESNNLN